MNKESLLEQLVESLGTVSIHSALINEITSLILRSGFEDRFLRLFSTRLKVLSQYKEDAVLALPDQYERLSHGLGELYSMHLTGKGFNVRILYAFHPEHSQVLLLAFTEKSGKRATGYSSFIPVALNRLEEFKKEDAEDHDREKECR